MSNTTKKEKEELDELICLNVTQANEFLESNGISAENGFNIVISVCKKFEDDNENDVVNTSILSGETRMLGGMIVEMLYHPMNSEIMSAAAKHMVLKTS